MLTTFFQSFSEKQNCTVIANHHFEFQNSPFKKSFVYINNSILHKSVFKCSTLKKKKKKFSHLPPLPLF